MADLQRLIRSALWFAVGVLIAAVPMLASAEDYIAPYANWGLNSSVTYIPPDGSSSSDAACFAWSTIYSAAKPEQDKGYTRKYARCYNPNTGTENGTVYSRAYCPYGGTLDSTVFPVFCRGAPPCESGQERNLDTGQCESPPPSCEILQNETILGFSETWDVNTPVQICASNCTGQFVYGDPAEVLNPPGSQPLVRSLRGSYEVPPEFRLPRVT